MTMVDSLIRHRTCLMAYFVLAAASGAPACAEPARADPVKRLKQEALHQLADILTMIRAGSDFGISTWAARVGFSYASGKCVHNQRFSKLCSYEISEQKSESARLILLALGRRAHSRAGGGRLVWAPWNASICLQTRDLSPILGAATQTSVSVSYLTPGQSTIPWSRMEYSYFSIPGAPSDARAVVTLQNGCALQLELDF